AGVVRRAAGPGAGRGGAPRRCVVPTGGRRRSGSSGSRHARRRSGRAEAPPTAVVTRRGGRGLGGRSPGGVLARGRPVPVDRRRHRRRGRCPAAASAVRPPRGVPVAPAGRALLARLPRTDPAPPGGAPGRRAGPVVGGPGDAADG